ncbi:MAG: hypothetical protein LPK20_13195 [Halomonas sp.]|uniref:Uncharacterized protein n=1 Tax=Billgrantia tianxiuensis TaxID=2497861 RepID=A0A6I6SGG4_9GAMM|nr:MULTISPECIES: hypothetical protein [Halomonas]MCE8032247.1 hypothetical protein [Halomonas sp. MCCC 1A11057]MDX5434516.1 hypothetical protein [Halomonas sp.]QHC49748.1 hypothetical protein EKK97_09195 [Halomonas tianxiuensis]
MGRLISLIFIAALAYGGLYVYYGHVVKQAIDEQLDARGLTALEVQRIEYDPLAPLSTQATIRAEVSYRGADATVTIRLHGHPIFSDEVRMELEGLQNLRLRFGVGG